MQNFYGSNERTGFVNNKLKKIYQEYEEYQLISQPDQELFDQIFSILWVEGHLNKKNEYLAQRFGYGKSTIEKKLRHMERAHLIYRDVLRKCDSETGRWTTERDIFLDEVFKSRLANDLKLKPAGLEPLEEPETQESFEEVSLPETVESLPQSRKSQPKFDFRKINR